MSHLTERFTVDLATVSTHPTTWMELRMAMHHLQSQYYNKRSELLCADHEEFSALEQTLSSAMCSFDSRDDTGSLSSGVLRDFARYRMLLEGKNVALQGVSARIGNLADWLRFQLSRLSSLM